MTTVMEEMTISSEEPVGEDGLTSQQRRVLYKLLCAGQITVPAGPLRDHHIAKALGLGSTIGNEIGASMDGLVMMGLVRHSVGPAERGAYGGTGDGQVVEAGSTERTFVPVGGVGVGNPVVAWIVVYGPLRYKEKWLAGAQEPYEYTIAEEMGEGRNRTLELVDFVKQAFNDHLLEGCSTSSTDSQLLSHGDKYPIMVMSIELNLVS